MIISVASGKGGTGKTTIATNLACALEGKAQLLDCDVEEPNGHLFLKPEIDSMKTVQTMVPAIDQDSCNGCGSCVEICRFNAITLVGDTVLTFPELCHGCGGCVEVCPEKAVSEGVREVGVVESGQSGSVTFSHGRLRIGEAMSPPLIRKVKEKASSTGDIIIDAPPGTSCPVITAIRGTDFVLLVTEPTPFGLHDLKLAVEVTRALAIPCGLVINRSDLGDSGVDNFAEKNNIPILMKMPFSRAIAEAYSKGEMIIKTQPQWKQKFIRLHQKIELLAACC